MTYFHIELDNKFNELFKQNRTFNKKDLIQLKSFIYNIYQKENSIEDLNIKNAYRNIDYKI